jgi:hypothetical protein
VIFALLTRHPRVFSQQLQLRSRRSRPDDGEHVRGLGTYWTEVHTGHNDITQDGANRWQPEDVAGKNHAYLVPKMPSGELAREIESLLAEPPRLR